MDIIEHKICRILPEVPARAKDETKEERKARKQMVKEHRRERRVEKKINKQMFKHEEKIQIAQMANQANQIKLPL
jgi:protein LTV1